LNAGDQLNELKRLALVLEDEDFDAVVEPQTLVLRQHTNSKLTGISTTPHAHKETNIKDQTKFSGHII
jgi:hypothetical protein